jgi:nucleoside-diphosphate-sugar epimerase
MDKTISGPKNQLVLVTGGSGFVGAYCILQLLKAGYTVRTTVRSLKREEEVRTMLKIGAVDAGDTLSFIAADLMSDAGWKEAVTGCDFVLRVASPFPSGITKHEDELIIPAREGTLRVLRASRDAGVKRVVLTSSFAAVGYSPKHDNEPNSEKDWTNPNDNISAYVKSKTIAELAAWDFIKREGRTLELTVINPVGIFGPVLGPDYSSSVQLLRNIMTGGMSAIPQISASIVDVRDVADIHVRAMTNPDANGERFLALEGDPMTFPEIAELLKKRMGDSAAHVSNKVVPNWVLRFTSIFKPSLRPVAQQLGMRKKATNEKAKRILGWVPRSKEEAIIATAESLVKLKLLKV